MSPLPEVNRNRMLRGPTPCQRGDSARTPHSQSAAYAGGASRARWSARGAPVDRPCGVPIQANAEPAPRPPRTGGLGRLAPGQSLVVAGRRPRFGPRHPWPRRRATFRELAWRFDGTSISSANFQLRTPGCIRPFIPDLVAPVRADALPAVLLVERPRLRRGAGG